MIIDKRGKTYDFSWLYEISNYGKIRNIKSGRILKQYLDRNGRYAIRLRCKGKRKLHGFSLSRLVATAFIPNFDNLPQVNHIDGDPRNNCVDNLEWCDESYNIQHAYNNNLMDRKLTRVNALNASDVISKKVNQYTLDGVFIKSYKSYESAGNAVGVSGNAIKKCCKGICKQSAGYIWRCVDDSELHIDFNNLIIGFDY